MPNLLKSLLKEGIPHSHTFPSKKIPRSRVYRHYAPRLHVFYIHFKIVNTIKPSPVKIFCSQSDNPQSLDPKSLKPHNLVLKALNPQWVNPHWHDPHITWFPHLMNPSDIIPHYLIPNKHSPQLLNPQILKLDVMHECTQRGPWYNLYTYSA